MAKKQAIATESAAGAAPARAAKPTTPRVTAAKHSKAVPVEPLTSPVSAVADAGPSVAADSREIIARIAYGYWEARGYSEGNPLEDWVRAENEYRQSLAALASAV